MLRNSQYMASLIAKPVALTQSKNPSRELWLEHYQAIQQEIIHIIIQSIYLYTQLREWKLNRESKGQTFSISIDIVHFKRILPYP